MKRPTKTTRRSVSIFAQIVHRLPGHLIEHLAARQTIRARELSYSTQLQLLVDREFCQRLGSYFFGSEREFKAFHSKLTELTHLLWADNEIARQNSIAQNTPHTTKNTPKKRGV